MDFVGPVANWRDADAYAPLLTADRSIFAWEWLRRDAGYRAAATRACRNEEGDIDAAFWGLHRFEDPSKAAPDARPIWRADCHPYVLRAKAGPASAPTDAIDVQGLAALATLAVEERTGEHWLLSDGLCAVRLDVIEGTASEGPVELKYLLAGRASASGPILTLRRLFALAETRRFSRTLHPTQAGARRWILALRAHDALAWGATQRQIAAVLLGNSAAAARWRINAASLRSQAQRLVRATRRFTDGGYRSFLGG
jgi:hypothetical protein